jgi:hypothetical protein
MKRVDITALTKREKELIIEAANFNDDQLAIFNALNANKLYDIGIMTQLGLPNHRYYDTKLIVCMKVERLAIEYGLTHILRRR